eukprot:PhF_6_TR30412/c0_g1_i1/m.44605
MRYLLMCVSFTFIVLLSLVAVGRSEDMDNVLVEDMADTPPIVKRKPTYSDDKEDHTSSSSKKSSSGGGDRKGSKNQEGKQSGSRRRRGEREGSPLETADQNSFALVKDLGDILQSGSFVDSDVMKEFHDKHDDTKKIVSTLQSKHKTLSSKEQANVPSEHVTLIFDTIPQRLQKFHLLSTEHKKLHNQIMESTVDVLQYSSESGHKAIVKYCEIRLRQNRYASQKNIAEMFDYQKSVRGSWHFGLTTFEWGWITTQTCIMFVLFTVAKVIMYSIVGSARLAPLLDAKSVVYPLIAVLVVNLSVRQMVSVRLSMVQMLAVCSLQCVVMFGLSNLGSMVQSLLVKALVKKRTGGKKLGSG